MRFPRLLRPWFLFRIQIEAIYLHLMRNVIRDRADRGFIPPVIESEIRGLHIGLGSAFETRIHRTDVRSRRHLHRRHRRLPAAISCMFEITRSAVQPMSRQSDVGRKIRLNSGCCAWPRRAGNTMSLNDPWRAAVPVSETKWKRQMAASCAHYYYWHTGYSLGCAPWSRIIVISRATALSVSGEPWDKSATVSHNRGESPWVEDAIDLSPFRDSD